MPRCGLMSGMRAPLNTKPSRRAPASTVPPPEDASLETASNAACRIWTSSGQRERPLSVQSTDLREDAGQWARRAERRRWATGKLIC